MLTTEFLFPMDKHPAYSAVWCVGERELAAWYFEKPAGGGLYIPAGWFSVPVYMGLYDHADH